MDTQLLHYKKDDLSSIELWFLLLSIFLENIMGIFFHILVLFHWSVSIPLPIPQILDYLSYITVLKFSRLIPPLYTSFSKLLSYNYFLHFYINFIISLSTCTKKLVVIMIKNYVKFVYQIWRESTFLPMLFFNPWMQYVFPFCYVLNFLHQLYVVCNMQVLYKVCDF